MSRAVGLQIVQYRPQMLYARRQTQKFVPVAILLGLAFFEGGVYLACDGARWSIVAGMALLSVGFFVMSPLLMNFGAWLSIDQTRGWVHYRLSGWQGRTQDSFSPQRIDSLRVRRCSCFGKWFGWWKLDLMLDHPRLGSVCLMRSWDLKRVERVAGDLSALLAVDWYDGRGSHRRDESLWIDLPPDALNTRHNLLPPPPEIEIQAQKGRTTLVLPHPGELERGMLMSLIYAIVWCLWAWTSVLFESRKWVGGVPLHARQEAVMALLGVASLIGVAILVRALFGMLARDELQASACGWTLVRRWLGLSLAPHRLGMAGIKTMRRIEPPNPLAGLWIEDERGGEVRLGAGLSVEALYWVQAMLRNDPQALRARPILSETGSNLNAGPGSDPGISTLPNARTDG